jgi:2-keto-4-pentenoate hydratase/2-oxohepta-3-ene-1,7-dioic acid hydratase in catechol pathway
MKLATFLLPGADAPHAGEVRGDTVVAFDDNSTVLDRIASGDRTPAAGAEHALADVRLLAPVPRPRAIFGVGLNYAAHARETNQEPPPAPMIFMKLPSSATAPNDDVAVPAAAAGRLDYEGELAVVIGAGGAIAGYAVADDLSARHLQKREKQWTRAKGFDNSAPYGPWITTADEIADPGALRLRTWVNGELRQDSSTSDLIFGVEEIVRFLAETCTLEPGDLILTGTPSGVGQALDPPQFLAGGDRIRIEIEALGAIEHAIAEHRARRAL